MHPASPSPLAPKGPSGSGASISFWLFLRNSVIVATVTTICQVFFSAMAAYAFARLRWPGRDKVFALFLAALMVPPIFTTLPNFALIKSLGLLNSFAGIILPSAFMTPFAIFFLRQFFLGISRELEEAAMIDGASRLQALVRVVLPLAAPGLAATAIFVILLAWNDFFYALILTSGNARTVTPYIGGFITDKAILWGRLYASSAIIMLPVLVFGLAVQKQLAHGLTGGAVKG